MQQLWRIPKPRNLYSSHPAKCDLCTEQVLIDKALNMPSHSIANYLEADILAMANKAIEKLTLTNQPSALPEVVGVKKFPSGAMFLKNEFGRSSGVVLTAHTNV